MLEQLLSQAVIDCDVNTPMPSTGQLSPYLSEHWQDYVARSLFRKPAGPAHVYPPAAPTTLLPSLRETGVSEIELGTVQQHLLAGTTTDYAVLNCYSGLESVRHPDFSAALATAVNEWQVEHWLRPEPRLRGSVVVSPHDLGAAVAEIERRAEDPAFVQVVLPVCSERPYGHRSWEPVLGAIEGSGLVLGLQFGGIPGNPPSQAGWPTSYLESFVLMAQVFQSQLMSLVVEGAFERHPRLRVTLLESGFTWWPSLAWRLDKEWKGLHREAPWVRRPPSSYLRDHVRVCARPVHGPPDRRHLADILEQLGSDELLLYSSDFPHHHGDDGLEDLLACLPDEGRLKLLHDNAAAWYGRDG